MSISTGFNPIETCFFIRKLFNYEPELVNKVKNMIVAMFLNSDWWNGSSFFDKSIVVEPHHYNFYYTFENWAHESSSFSFTDIPFHKKLMESLSIPKVSYDAYENIFITNTGAEGTIGKSGRIVSKNGTKYNFFEIRDFIFKEGEIVVNKKENNMAEYGSDNTEIEIDSTPSSPNQGYDSKSCKKHRNCYGGSGISNDQLRGKWEEERKIRDGSFYIPNNPPDVLEVREVCEYRFPDGSYCDCNYNSIKKFNFALESWYGGYKGYVNKKTQRRETIYETRYKISSGIEKFIDNAFINEWDDKLDEEISSIPNICVIINVINDFDEKIRLMCQYNCSTSYNQFKWKIMDDTMYKKIVWKHKQQIN